jgi:hypothetical protein
MWGVSTLDSLASTFTAAARATLVWRHHYVKTWDGIA